MPVDQTRFADDVNKMFVRQYQLFYRIGGAYPTNEAEAPTNAWKINTAAETGGLGAQSYRSILLSGGTGVPVAAKMNAQLVGEVTAGTIAEMVFEGITILVRGVNRIEEVRFQYIIQDGDDIEDIIDNLVLLINDYIQADAIPANTRVRCTNLEANDQAIQAGLALKYSDDDAPVAPELVPAVKVGDDVISIRALPGIAGNTYAVGATMLDAPPSQLPVNTKGAPTLPGFKHYGYTINYAADFSATQGEILSDQVLPPTKRFLSAQTAQATFDFLQDEDASLLSVPSGTGSTTNNSTGDFFLPSSRDVQDSYSLVFTCRNANGIGFDYIWLYFGKSGQLALKRSVRAHNPISVTFACDPTLGRSDLFGHYYIAYSF